MKRIYLFFCMFICCLFVVNCTSITVHASPTYTIEYDKQAGKLIKSSGDPFEIFKDLIPGDSKTAEIELKNSSLTPRELKYFVSTNGTLASKQKDLASNIDVKIVMASKGTDTLIYSGPLIKDSNPLPTSLGTISAGSTSTLKVTVSLPNTLDNTYADTSIPTIWKFYVYDSGLKVDTPEAIPVGDTYDEEQLVELSCSTEGATLRYTVDGSTPSGQSPIYSEKIRVSKNTVIKAYATKDEYEDSDIMIENYKIKCAPPKAIPSGGTYENSQSVSLTTTTPNATIYYTVDGTMPSEASNKYVSPILITKNTTIIAFATRDDMENSDNTTEVYKIKCCPPKMNPPSGTYDDPQRVEITSETPDCTIHYTTDGSEPNPSSPVYNTPIVIDKNTTVKAIATKDECENSSVTTEIYKIKLAPPAINPSSGTFTDNVTVTITHEQDDVTIKYTIDGSEPNANSPTYSGPLFIAENTTVRAIAIKNNYENSPSAKESYIIKLAPPTIKPSSGSYTERVSVIIVHDRPDVKIRYTTDGSEPTSSSPLYTEALVITQDAKITAKAFKANTLESSPSAEKYKILPPKDNIAPPVIRPESGTYPDKITVTITHPDPTVTIRYTPTGEEPTENSPIYTGSFDIDSNTSVSAKAYPKDTERFNPSASVTETYKFVLQPPQITPKSGTFEGEVTVTIDHPDPDAIIRYTVDGSDPTEKSPIYEKPFKIEKSATVTARAFSYVKLTSEPASEEYVIKSKKPTILPDSGEYPDKVTVTIHHPNPDAIIHYTVDGSTPDENSPIYEKPFDVSDNSTVTAIAVVPGTIPSEPTSEQYTVKLAPPTIDPKGSVFDENVLVVITHKDPFVTIRYTTDGTIPNENSTPYTEPLLIDKNTTVTAIATKSTNVDSEPASEKYDIKVATPIITPESNEFDYNSEVTVKITCSTPNSIIYYTTDGSSPSRTSPLYSGEFIVNKDSVITAFAVADNMVDSDNALEKYTFSEQGQVAKPKASPSGGNYDEEVSVRLTCTTPGATIYYTTDGKTPTTDSKKYTKPIPVGKYTIIKAIAVKDGMKDSKQLKEEYEFTVATPIADPPGGTYSEIQYVTLSCETEDATIHYSLDGSEPNENSPVYTTPIKIDRNTILKAYAVLDGWNDSDIITEEYIISIPEETPPLTETAPPEEPPVEITTPAETTPIKTGVESQTSIINPSLFILLAATVAAWLVVKKN